MAQDIFIHREGTPANRVMGLLAATQSFKAGAPVTLSSGAIATCPADGTEVLDGEIYGIAVTPAAGVHAASRTGAANGFGAATGDYVTVIPLPELQSGRVQLRTANFWATGGQTRATPVGADIGALFQLTYNNQAGFNMWGVEETAGTPDTDCVVHVDAVLDENGIPLQVADTTGGKWVVFHLSAGDNLFSPFTS
jgi:hypothetical protein